MQGNTKRFGIQQFMLKYHKFIARFEILDVILVSCLIGLTLTGCSLRDKYDNWEDDMDRAEIQVEMAFENTINLERGHVRVECGIDFDNLNEEAEGVALQGLSEYSDIYWGKDSDGISTEHKAGALTITEFSTAGQESKTFNYEQYIVHDSIEAAAYRYDNEGGWSTIKRLRYSGGLKRKSSIAKVNGFIQHILHGAREADIKYFYSDANGRATKRRVERIDGKNLVRIRASIDLVNLAQITGEADAATARIVAEYIESQQYSGNECVLEIYVDTDVNRLDCVKLTAKHPWESVEGKIPEYMTGTVAGYQMNIQFDNYFSDEVSVPDETAEIEQNKTWKEFWDSRVDLVFRLHRLENLPLEIAIGRDEDITEDAEQFDTWWGTEGNSGSQGAEVEETEEVTKDTEDSKGEEIEGLGTEDKIESDKEVGTDNRDNKYDYSTNGLENYELDMESGEIIEIDLEERFGEITCGVCEKYKLVTRYSIGYGTDANGEGIDKLYLEFVNTGDKDVEVDCAVTILKDNVAINTGEVLDSGLVGESIIEGFEIPSESNKIRLKMSVSDCRYFICGKQIEVNYSTGEDGCLVGSLVNNEPTGVILNSVKLVTRDTKGYVSHTGKLYYDTRIMEVGEEIGFTSYEDLSKLEFVSFEFNTIAYVEESSNY